ncbi:MAG: FG-GAP-like repeat-containing protein, partial [Gemmataceae bacterium]
MSDERFSPGREGAPSPSSVFKQPRPTSPEASSGVRGRRWGLWIALLLMLLLAAGAGAWWWRQRPAVDWEAVHAQNNRAIAIMEGYHYPEAIVEFEKVVKMAPDWLPGRINLGMAQLNASGSDPKWVAPCKATFEEVLRRDADNPHAHFCLGILLKYNEDGKEAIRHFEAVLKKVPNDAYSLYWIGHLKMPGSAEQTAYFRKALQQNRHLTGAIYGLSQNLRLNDAKEAQKLLDELEALKRSDWENIVQIKYSRMGPLAEVLGGTNDPSSVQHIGPLPLFERRQGFTVQLAPGVRWAKASDFGEDAVGEVRRLVRARFGATMVVLDYNGDRKPDLFLAGAVVEKGKVRDLLLRNDGFGHFRDVTAEAGLAEPRPTLGCVVADVDNDGKPDLLMTGAGVQKLFRNTGKGAFEDVSAKATLDKVASVCLGAAGIDL